MPPIDMGQHQQVLNADIRHFPIVADERAVRGKDGLEPADIRTADSVPPHARLMIVNRAFRMEWIG